MKYRLLAVATSCLLVLGHGTAAQGLTGKIVDAGTNQPVPYASVVVLNAPLGTTSNAEGEFELNGMALPAKLVVSELGHRRDTVAVTTAGPPLLIRLQPATVLLPEVQVGSYLGDLLAQAYRQLRRTHGRKTYGQAFYRQVTQLDDEATEVQEMVWDAETSNAGVEGTALAQGRFAKKKALLSFNNFSVYTKAFSLFDAKADSSTLQGLIGPNAARYFVLKLVGVTQNGPQQLVEIDFASRPEVPTNRERGTIVIDETTHQILRLRLEAPGFRTKSTNPLYKFKNESTQVEWVFAPRPGGAATLDYLKITRRATIGRLAKADVRLVVSSFTYCYNGHPTPDARVTYAPAKGGEVDLTAIRQIPYDPAFWHGNPVVKRTPIEEQVMKSFEQKGAFGTLLTP